MDQQFEGSDSYRKWPDQHLFPETGDADPGEESNRVAGAGMTGRRVGATAYRREG